MRTYHNPQAGRWRCSPTSLAALRFHEGIDGYAPTRLVDAPDLARQCGISRMLIKDESGRFDLGAFKILGTTWAIFQAVAAATEYSGPARLPALLEWLGDRPRPCLVTATDGNHGRAVARVATEMATKARVYVPEVTPASALRRIAEEGAEVHVVKGSYDDALRLARADSETHPEDLLVQDTAWPGYTQFPDWIVEGYSTLFLEIEQYLEQAGIDHVDAIFVPVGVGSLAQAAIAHYRSHDPEGPQTSVISVEPDTAACVLSSLLIGELTTVPTGATPMNGLNCGTPSSLAWPALQGGLDVAMEVSDAQAAAAVGLLHKSGIASAPTGAASLAGALALLAEPDDESLRAFLELTPDSVVVCLNTEGFATDGPADGSQTAYATSSITEPSQEAERQQSRGNDATAVPLERVARDDTRI